MTTDLDFSQIKALVPVVEVFFHSAASIISHHIQTSTNRSKLYAAYSDSNI